MQDGDDLDDSEADPVICIDLDATNRRVIAAVDPLQGTGPSNTNPFTRMPICPTNQSDAKSHHSNHLATIPTLRYAE